MRPLLLALAAIITVIALFAMIETVWTAISRPEAAIERFKDASKSFGKSRIYLTFAVIGFIGIVYCGTYSLLFWIPYSWGIVNQDGEFSTLRHSISGLFTALALPLVGVLADHARLLSDARRLKQTIKGVEKMIHCVNDLEPFIEKLSIEKGVVPKDIRAADLWWLDEQAKILQHNVTRVINDSLARERKALEEKEAATTAEIEARSVLIQNKFNWVEAILNKLPALPIANDIATGGQSDWMVLPTKIVTERWSKLEDLFSSLSVPKEMEQDELRLVDISKAFLNFPGMDGIKNLKVVGHYRGGTHGGDTTIVATLNGRDVGLSDIARFDRTIDGICSAFFIAHILPTYGRFWHGLYNNDYTIFLDYSSLGEWLFNNAGLGKDNCLQRLDRGAGLRIKVDGSKLRVAALGAGLTTPLTDFSIELAGNRIIGSTREVLGPSNGILY
ncbi:hypothetical protein [Hahella sp. NBU794]|uniref:hypothetical protein n=1 Tax=Hahella sp. NBU794 TaxID=3422590 RepID=UPI003D6F7A00